MRQAKAGAAEGLCVVAREQTRGRGRLDRSWHSSKDAGLYFSVILRPSFKLFRWPLISLAAALAVYDALAKVFGLAVDIKWPNDIIVGDRKLAGILAETVETPDGAALVLGIGINLTSENFPPALDKLATSIAEVTKAPVNRESLITALVKSLNQRYEMLQMDSGDKPIIHDWCERSSYAYDRHVCVAVADDSFEGITRGLERDGALRVETSEGATKIVRAGDVTALRATNVARSDQ